MVGLSVDELLKHLRQFFNKVHYKVHDKVHDKVHESFFLSNLGSRLLLLTDWFIMGPLVYRLL